MSRRRKQTEEEKRQKNRERAVRYRQKLKEARECLVSCKDKKEVVKIKQERDEKQSRGKELNIKEMKEKNARKRREKVKELNGKQIERKERERFEMFQSRNPKPIARSTRSSSYRKTRSSRAYGITSEFSL